MAARTLSVGEPLPMRRQRSNSAGDGEHLPVRPLPVSHAGLLTKERRRRSLDCKVLQQTRKITPSSGLSLPKPPKKIVHNLKTGGQDLNSKPKKVLLSIKKGSENVNRVGMSRAKKAGRLFRDAAAKASGTVLGLLPKRRRSEKTEMPALQGLGTSYAAPVAKEESSGKSVSLVHLVFLAAFVVVQIMMGTG